MAVYLYGLDEYGLTLRQLSCLKDRRVFLRVYLQPINQKELFSLRPTNRKERMREWSRQKYRLVCRQWPSQRIECIGPRSNLGGIRSEIAAKEIVKVASIKGINSIWIDGIQGMKKKPSKLEPRWYAVEARFAIQVEGQVKGLQTYEDRIVILKARSSDDAEKCLQKEFRQYAHPYLNTYGEMVRWKFEKILDVYDMGDDHIDPKGTEVFSRLKQRRIRPHLQWHPLKKKQS